MSANSCSEALRIIGSDLEYRGIKTFFLRCHDNLFVVEGGYQSPPAVTPITLHYALEDIEQLECKVRQRNDHLSAPKNFLSLPQIFWAIGTYVTAKDSCLLTVSNTSSTEALPIIRMEYETVHGVRCVVDVTGSAIYELSVSAYKMRGTSSLEKIRYTRFSHLQGNN